MSRTTKIIVGVVVLVLLLGVAVAVAVQFQGRGPQVDTATVEKVDLSVTVSASGKAEPGRSGDVYPPTTGTLTEVFVTEGERVKAGQKLAQMDKAQLRVAVEQARAGIETARAQLETVDNNAPAGPDITAAEANVDAAEAAYNASKAQLAALDDAGPTSLQKAAAASAVKAARVAYNNARTAYNIAFTAYKAAPTPANRLTNDAAQTGQYQAKAALDSALASQASMLATDMATAEKQACAAVAQSKAALRTAEANQAKLLRTRVEAQRAAAVAGMRSSAQALVVAQNALEQGTLVAPIDGTVFFNNLGQPEADGSGQVAAVGAGVAPQIPPFTVVDLKGSTFVAEVDEADIGRVKTDQQATIRFDAYPGEEVMTTVTRVQPAARQTATGGTVFPVDLALADTPLDILIGMKGDAEIKVKALPEAVVIPIEALFDENGETFVYVLQEGDVLKKTPIEVGATTETQVQVISGVKPGDVVALSGSTELKDGMTVRPNPQ